MTNMLRVVRVMVPTGTMWPTAVSVAPDDRWLMCFGQSVSADTYPNLYNAVGASYMSITDLCTNTANAVSGGDEGSHAKANAFDDNTSTEWQSSQEAGAISGAAYIGYDFGADNEKYIRHIKLYSSNCVSSLKVQYSDNGSGWVDVETVDYLPDGASTNGFITINLPSTAAHRYWRLLANANLSSGRWAVNEVEMCEVLTNFNLPDMRGAMPVGMGMGSGLTYRGVGQTGGEETHTLDENEMPSHTHGPANDYILGRDNTSGANPSSWGTDAWKFTFDSATASAGSGQAHNNMPPFIGVNWIIKT